MIKEKNNENLHSQFKDKIIVVTGSTQEVDMKLQDYKTGKRNYYLW